MKDWLCKCGTRNPFSAHARLNPTVKIVEQCGNCGRKNVVLEFKVIRYGKLEQKEQPK